MSDGSGIARLSQHDAVRRGEVLPIVPPTYEGPLAGVTDIQDLADLLTKEFVFVLPDIPIRLLSPI